MSHGDDKVPLSLIVVSADDACLSPTRSEIICKSVEEIQKYNGSGGLQPQQ